ncbi:MAG TPA: DHHA1 domain-containing protein, partial [Ignavibacteriaceae bacterium]
RIEAVTGHGVEEYINSQLNKIRESEERVAVLQEEKKRLEKDLDEFRLKEKLGQIDNIIKHPVKMAGISVYKGEVDAGNMDELKTFGDELRNKTKDSVGVLISRMGDKAGVVCVVNDELLKSTKLNAGKIVGSLAKILGGGGGGKPHLATAGGKDVSKIPDALKDVEKTIQSYL